MNEKLKTYWTAWKRKFLLGASGVLVLLLPLYFGIWLPDRIGVRPNVLAELHRDNGETVRVIQYWRTHLHGTSRYKTEFRVTASDGKLIKLVILEDDDDTRKRWRIPPTVSLAEGHPRAVVTLSPATVKTIDW